MNRITGFTDPDFSLDQDYHVTPEQAYSRERLAWQVQQQPLMSREMPRWMHLLCVWGLVAGLLGVVGVAMWRK